MLLNTPLADAVLKEHIVPVLDLICSIEPKVTLKGRFRDALFEQGVTTPAALPSTENAASVYSGMVLTLFPQTAGNVPGPFSFSVVIVAAAQGYIQSRFADVATDRKFAGQLLRFKVIIGTFNQQRFDQIASHIEANDFTQLRNFDWAKNFQSGPTLSGIVAIVYWAALLKDVVEDDELSRSSALQICCSQCWELVWVFSRECRTLVDFRSLWHRTKSGFSRE